MLTTTQHKYIEICTAKIASPSTTGEELAKQFNSSPAGINLAIKWGKEQGIFTGYDKELISRSICELQSVASDLEEELKRLKKCNIELLEIWEKTASGKKRKKKSAKSAPRFYSRDISFIAKQLLDYKTRIMELQGLYKRVVNVNVVGKRENLLYDAICDLTETFRGQNAVVKPEAN